MPHQYSWGFTPYCAPYHSIIYCRILRLTRGGSIVWHICSYDCIPCILLVTCCGNDMPRCGHRMANKAMGFGLTTNECFMKVEPHKPFQDNAPVQVRLLVLL